MSKKASAKEYVIYLVFSEWAEKLGWLEREREYRENCLVGVVYTTPNLESVTCKIRDDVVVSISKGVSGKRRLDGRPG